MTLDKRMHPGTLREVTSRKRLQLIIVPNALDNCTMNNANCYEEDDEDDHEDDNDEDGDRSEHTSLSLLCLLSVLGGQLLLTITIFPLTMMMI